MGVRFYRARSATGDLRGRNRFVLRFYRHSHFGRPSGGRGLFVLRFYGHSLFGRPSGGAIVLFCVFTGILFSVGPPAAPSFVARRKIGEKGVSRGCGPLNPRGNVLGHSDVLCANRLATVHLTRLRRLRRSAYPLASACCTAQNDRNTHRTT